MIGGKKRGNKMEEEEEEREDYKKTSEAEDEPDDSRKVKEHRKVKSQGKLDIDLNRYTISLSLYSATSPLTTTPPQYH